MSTARQRCRSSTEMGDPASDVLSGLRIVNLELKTHRHEATWQNRLGEESSHLYAVRNGVTTLSIQGETQPHRLQPGCVAFVFGTGHVIAGHPVERPPAPTDGFDLGGVPLDGCTYEDHSRECRVLSGRFSLSVRGMPVELGLLPRLLVSASDDPAVQSSIDELESELAAGRPCSRLIVENVATTLLLKTLRPLLDGDRPSIGPLAAAVDEHIGPVLGLMHAYPGKDWTLQRLADEAGLSRSRFAAHFTDRIGQSPFAYLREVRLARAAELLRASAMPVSDVGRAIGYASESAFTAAFRRWSGSAPGVYRLKRKDPGDSAAGI